MSNATAPRARLFLGSKLLLGANGVLWIVLGAMWLGRASALLAALMFGNAVILITLAFRIRPTSEWLLRMALIWVGVNLLLSFADEVGPADLMVGALNAVTLLVLAVFLRAHGRPSP